MFFDQYGNLMVNVNIPDKNNTADGISGATILPVALYSYNGTSWDRVHSSNSGGNQGVVRVAIASTDGTGLQEQNNVSDGVGGLACLAVSNYPMLWNGASWDRQQGSNGAATTQDLIRALTTAGKAYVVTTGKQTAPGSATLGFQLFNPANSGKSLLITRLYIASAGAAIHDVRLTSADISTLTGYTSVALTPVNKRAGGSASVATANSSNTNITGAPIGTSIYTPGSPVNTTTDILPPGAGILLPATTTVNGLAVYFNATGTNAWAVGCEYLEY